MLVEAVLISVVAVAAFMAILFFFRARRLAVRPVLPAWEPVFSPGEVAAMFTTGQITATERDRLLAILQKQQVLKEVETPPLGPRGFPVQPLESPPPADPTPGRHSRPKNPVAYHGDTESHEESARDQVL